MNKDSSNMSSVTPLDLLQLLFIALKLMGYIDWSWWWVFSPMWIALILAIIIVFVTK